MLEFTICHLTLSVEPLNNEPDASKLEQDPNDTGFEGMRSRINETTSVDLFDLVSLKMAV